MSQGGGMPAGADIGHVNLKVADLERALGFWRDVLGFSLTARFGDDAAFLSAGGYHHHIGLNTWESRGGSPPPRERTGLHHVAIRFPDRASLGAAVRRVMDADVRLQGASDHGVCESVYVTDPDGNRVELMVDRPREAWPRETDGRVRFVHEPLDLRALLEEAVRAAPSPSSSEGS